MRTVARVLLLRCPARGGCANGPRSGMPAEERDVGHGNPATPSMTSWRSYRRIVALLLTLAVIHAHRSQASVRGHVAPDGLRERRGVAGLQIRHQAPPRLH